MLAYFLRQRVVGALIVVLTCVLCVSPMISRGQGSSSGEAAPGGSGQGQTTFYAPPSADSPQADEKVNNKPLVTAPPAVVPPVAVPPVTAPTDGFDFQGAPLAPRNHAGDPYTSSPDLRGMVTIDDILAMTRAGVPEHLIVSHIESRAISPYVTTDDVLRAQQQGVAARVVAAAQRSLDQRGKLADPRLATPEHIVESKSFFLVSTKYRLPSGKAKALSQLLAEQIGRPEIFEVALEEPNLLNVIASPRAQNAIGELVALARAAPADDKAVPDKKLAAENKAAAGHEHD